MSKSIISEGKTTSEAIEKGLKELNVSKDKVDIKILDNKDKKSFFSILAPRIVKVELTLKEDIKSKENIVKKERPTADSGKNRSSVFFILPWNLSVPAYIPETRGWGTVSDPGTHDSIFGIRNTLGCWDPQRGRS